MAGVLRSWAFSLGVLAMLLAPRPVLAQARPANPPRNNGPVKLLTCSWLGGGGDDEIVAVEIAADGTIVLAGNAPELKVAGVRGVLLAESGGRAMPPPRKRETAAADTAPGFVVRLSADGRKVLSVSLFGAGISIRKMQLDSRGNIGLLGSAPGGIKGFSDKGEFIARLPADGSRLGGVLFVAKASDMAIDGNGECVVLADAKLNRFTPDGKLKWQASWKAWGSNHPAAIALDPVSGVTSVVGYGMTHTGREPYKDPYAYGFDRAGKQVWAMWNPDPKLEAGSGNGLMADTTGHAAGVAPGGRLYLILYADGGNSVCTRSPGNVDVKLPDAVFKGSQQAGPGFGFKGASKTSVLFRLNAATGEIEKGTWLSAWITPARANGLAMDAVTGDEGQRTFIVGNSASGCPTKEPWYESPEGGYKGGGFLAVCDANLKFIQAGYFPGTTMRVVSHRGNIVAIAGSAPRECRGSDPLGSGAEATYPVPTLEPVQPTFGGGQTDGWFAVFRLPDRP